MEVIDYCKGARCPKIKAQIRVDHLNRRAKMLVYLALNPMAESLNIQAMVKRLTKIPAISETVEGGENGVE